MVGGARGTTGAAALAARAAFRADAGYVAIAAPADALPTLETLVVEAVKRPLESRVRRGGTRVGARARPGSRARPAPLVRRLLEQTELPAVVDADALYELEPFERAAPTVLTPHSGELARLLDEDSSWIDAHRLAALQRAVDRFGCIVLLKGADTLIGAPGEGVWTVGQSVPALATAGTGDVLTGIVAAFLAKGMDARVAAAAAAVLHRRAALTRDRGLVAGGPRRRALGMTPGDVRVWRRLRQDRLVVASGVLVLIVVVLVYAGPKMLAHFLGHGPNDPLPYAVDENLRPAGPWTRVAATSTTIPGASLGQVPEGTPHTLLVLGGDGPLGRDELLRLLDGGRVSLEVAVGATLLAFLLGLIAGACAGYYGGWIDARSAAPPTS